MKRIFALLICLATVLCLTACGQEEQTTAPSSTEAEIVNIPGQTDFPEQPSEGLEYAVNEDEVSCTITGIGTCTDVYISVGATLDGYAVTAIGQRAFFSNTDIVGIRLADSITSIGEYAFFECTNLQCVSLGNGMVSLETYAFAGCVKLETLAIPESMERIAQWAFYGCAGMQSVSITNLERWCAIVFEGIYSNPLMVAGQLVLSGQPVTQLTIPESVESVSELTFAGCTSLESVQFHENVTGIGARAFMQCTNIREFVYPGTKEQWKAISFGANWDYLISSYVVVCDDGQISG